MVVADARIAPSAPPALMRAPDWRALLLGLGGMLVTFAAPPHRPDLLLIGLAASAFAIVWSPLVGAVLIGGLLPAFFFGRGLVGPLSVTPPGLALILTWLAIGL